LILLFVILILRHYKQFSSNKIQLGVNLRGLGAGANPDVGQQSAIESIADIEKCWIEIPRWFYYCRMGGGTGTGLLQ
jgi:cell division protein FtsZ